MIRKIIFPLGFILFACAQTLSAQTSRLLDESGTTPEKPFIEETNDLPNPSHVVQSADPFAQFLQDQIWQAGAAADKPQPVAAVPNGDFSQNTTGTPFPNGWSNRVADGYLPAYLTSYDGKSGVINLTRNSNGGTGLKQDFASPVVLDKFSRCEITFKIAYAALVGDGYYGIEAPLVLRLSLQHQDGSTFQKTKFFNYRGDSDSASNPDFSLVDQNQWMTKSFSYQELNLAEGDKLTGIEVMSSGWERESYVDSVQWYVNPLLINQGAENTATRNVSLAVAVPDNGKVYTDMSYAINSWDPTAFSAWEPYASAKQIQLSNYEGINYVNLRVRDGADQISYFWNSIRLDRAAPTGSLAINGGEASTTSRTVSLNLAATDAGSGVTEMSYAFNSLDDAAFSAWEPYSATKQVQLPAYPGRNYVNVRVKDGAGNVQLLWSSIVYQSPLTINDDSGYTSSRNVTLNLSSGGWSPVQMCYAFNSLDDAAFTAWEPFSAAKQVQLPAYQGTNYVNVKVRDSGGNITLFWKSVVLDQNFPTGSLTINEGAEYTTTRNVQLHLAASDIGSGIVEMSYAVNSLEESAFSAWETFQADKSVQISNYEGRNYVNIRVRDRAGNVSLFWASIYLQYNWPSVPTGWTRTSSNPNFAFEQYYSGGPHSYDPVYHVFKVRNAAGITFFARIGESFSIGGSVQDYVSSVVDVSPDGGALVYGRYYHGSYYADILRTGNTSLKLQVTLNAKLKSILFNENNTATLQAQNESSPATCYDVDLSSLTIVQSYACPAS